VKRGFWVVLERKMGLDNYNVSRGTIIMNFLVLFQGWVFDGFAFILFLFLSSGFKGVFYLRKTTFGLVGVGLRLL
jgi:hypothetical protein